ncbi:MAG: hypothetical protein JNJ69_16115 [Leptospiraceae bacterium]|nr:hypothetical protein [Leptospiraceae bacterium]
MFSRKWNFMVAVSVTAASLFSIRPAEASCGLHVCPIPVAVRPNQSAVSGAQAMPSQVWLETRFATFDIGGNGNYLQTSLTGIFEHRLFRAGGLLPVIYLNAPTGSTTGLGNSLLFGEVYVISTAGTRLSLGSQLETPTGNHDKGLGADHFMAIPYVNFWQTVDAWRFAVQAGYQQTIGSHSHTATATPLYVNPHADSEVISRAMLSYTYQSTWTGELNSSVRQVTAHDAVGDKTFVDAGVALRAAFGSALALRAGVDVPLLSRQRYLLQTYIGCFYYF